jgi:peptidoglycan/LPS O-acetylase OafA/YrhL
VPGRVFSFNGPVWSISVELFLYIVFFVFAVATPRSWRVRRIDPRGDPILNNRIDWYRLMGGPLGCFFLGGLAARIYLQWLRTNKSMLILAVDAIGLFIVSLNSLAGCL